MYSNSRLSSLESSLFEVQCPLSETVLYSVSIVVFAPQHVLQLFVAEADGNDGIELGDLTVLSRYERLDIVFVVATIFLGLELVFGL